MYHRHILFDNMIILLLRQLFDWNERNLNSEKYQIL